MKQDIGPRSLAWGADFPQRVLEAGMTQTPLLLPLSPPRGVGSRWVVPSRILSSPRAHPLAPAPLSKHPQSSRTCSRHPRITESTPAPSPSPHLGTADTPPGLGTHPHCKQLQLPHPSSYRTEMCLLTVPPEVTTLLLNAPLGSSQC